MNVLITGATSGIGRQLALDYVAAGHHVIACGRNIKKLTELTNEVPDASHITTAVFDVTNHQQTQAVLQDTLTQLAEPLDVAILNAGVCEYVDDARKFEVALVERVFAANFFGVVNCISALLTKLQKGSKLVVVDSMARQFPFTRAEAYGASKAAVHYFASALRTDIVDTGIQVITVSPGFVKTPMTDANDFEMPMRISVAEASQAMRKGIAKGKAHIAFPSVFGFILASLQRLPYRVQIALSKRMRNH